MYFDSVAYCVGTTWDVTVSSGTLTVDTATDLDAFMFTGGTVNVNQDLTAASLAWDYYGSFVVANGITAAFGQ